MSKISKIKTGSTIFLYFLCIPIVLWFGLTLYEDRNYSILSILIALLASIPFFLKYEKRKPPAREIMIVAILCALAITSRLLFAFLPAFKPVTAIVIIAGMAFGKETGFMCGAISAIVSNIFFGQGPWTPFQMISWGIIGYFAGVLNRKHLLEQQIPLYLYACFAGVVFSVVMDIWSVFSIDRSFSIHRYLALLVTSAPFMLAYAMSNVVFLFLLAKPMMKKLKRVKLKYGIGDDANEICNEL